MNRIAQVFFALVAAIAIAWPSFQVVAQSTKAQLNSTISTNLADNTTGAITPAILRSVLNDMVASLQQAWQVNAQTGTSYTFLVGDYGKLVTFSNGSSTAVTLPQATVTFATFNVLVRNLGVGLVTITPTTSTINGAATLALGTGQSAWIIAGGGNYQILQNPNAYLFRPPTNGTAITITPAASTFARGIGQQQAFSGVLGSTDYFINYHIIDEDADASGTVPNTLYGSMIKHTVGGSPTRGSRAAFRSDMTLNGATSASNTNRFYLGEFITATAVTGDGGTNTGAGAKGYVGGSNIAAITSAAATNLETVIGLEVNTNLFAGTTLRSRFGVAIGPTGGGASQGAVNDAGIYMFAVGGTSGWQDGIHFDSTVSAPVSATGSIIRASGGFTALNGINFASASFTDNFLRGPSDTFKVTGIGAVTAKSIALTTGANGSYGTFTCVSASNVVINNTSIAAGDVVVFFYESGAAAAPGPYGNARNNGTSFQVACATSDTAVYNYAIIKKGT